jgi:uncharacterized protein YndB with AHSA1/START domain
MKNFISYVLLALLAFSSATFAVAQTKAAATVSPPQKLTIEIEVPAPVADVWLAFSTSEGLSTWLTPEATVDLRPGGDWICRFPGGSTGGGTIVSFVPEKELVVAALAPDKFPHVRAERTRAAFQFEQRGESTIVRLTQTGWKRGEEWIRAYEYLLAGNRPPHADRLEERRRVDPRL